MCLNIPLTSYITTIIMIPISIRVIDVNSMFKDAADGVSATADPIIEKVTGWGLGFGGLGDFGIKGLGDRRIVGFGD